MLEWTRALLLFFLLSSLPLMAATFTRISYYEDYKYTTKIAAPDFTAHSTWNPKNENPSLSTRAVIASANKMLSEVLPEERAFI